ncbi:MAG: PAS domain S-box protein [bacterium]|nr:PAS domain S-box protein [bacterium]
MRGGSRGSEELARRKRAGDGKGRTAEALRFVLRETATVAPEEFLRALTRSLCEALGVRHAFVCERIEGEPRRARVLTGFSDGNPAETHEYDLKGTPCDNVMGRQLCFYERDVARRFSEDSFLTGLGIDSYMAHPFFGSRQKTLGILSLMHDGRFPDPEAAEQLLRIFAPRAGTEVERRRAEEELRRSEAKYRVLFERSGDAMLILDGDRFVDCNAAAVSMLGFERHDQVLQSHPWSISPEFQPDGRSSREKAEDILSRAFVEGSQRFEWTHLRSNGEPFPVEVLLTAVPVGQKPVVHVVWRDLSDRKRDEAALRSTEATLASIFRAAPAGIGLVSDRVFMQVNQRLCEMVGYDESDLIGRNARMLYHTEEEYDRVGMEKYGLISRRGTGTVETKWVRKDGRLIDVVTSSTPVNPEDLSVGVTFTVMDVTERKRFERELAIFKQFAESSSLGHGFADLDGHIVYINPALSRMIRVDRPADVFGKNIAQFYAAEDRSRLAHEILPLVEKNGHWIGEAPLKSADGGILPTIQSISLIRDADGNPIYLGCVVNDIRERKKAEEALRASEEQYRRLVETMTEGFIVVDGRGCVTLANDRACSMFGSSREQLVGRSVRELVDARNLGVLEEHLTGPVRNDRFSYELTWTGKDNSDLLTLVSPRPIFDKKDEYKGFFAVLTDISELKQLEERVARAEKLEVLGRLAGTVAHDLNNVLSGLVTYPDLLLMQTPEDSPIRKPLETIRRSGERAAVIVEDLLTLTRRGVASKKPVDLNQIVTEHLRSPEYSRRVAGLQNLQVECNLQPDSPCLNGSAHHLTQTVSNLVSNAIDAMSDGGRLMIGTRNEFLDKPLKGYASVKEGEYAVLEVCDTGHGIPAEETKRVFEPFYTSKEMGKSGTGLGLTVVWGTVNDHKGYIGVDSEIGRGTSFRLYFPATKAPRASCAEGGEEVRTGVPGAGQSILVVDDVPSQREIASSMLAALGYRVKSADSGEDAVELVRRQPFDLILLDMIMGEGMDGLDTFRTIQQFKPDQRVIIASGYAESQRVRDALRLGAGRYIKKPYSLEAITRAIELELAV